MRASGRKALRTDASRNTAERIASARAGVRLRTVNEGEALLGELRAVAGLEAVDRAFFRADPGAEVTDGRREIVEASLMADEVQLSVGVRSPALVAHVRPLADPT
jgi:hypothetical protein